MKKITLLFVLIVGIAKSQQLPQLTQFMINDYAINPAIAGMDNYYQVKTSVRNQWVGINDAPKTTLLSIYGRHANNVGLGGSVFNDQVGPTSRSGASVTYAYHFNITPIIKASMALSGGFTQFKIDKTGWNLADGGNRDQLLEGAEVVDLVPDATFGVNFYKKDEWYIGVAVPQLLNSKLVLIDDDFANNVSVDLDGSLSRHIYAMGLYHIRINNYWDIEPSMLFKYTSSESILDIGAKTIYKDNFWMGLDYRTNGDLSALFGVNLKDRYMIGYSYDILTSSLNEFSSGSHEFMFGLSFFPFTEKQITR